MPRLHVYLRLFAVISLLSFCPLRTSLAAIMITVAPGSSPAEGYLPLSLIGVTPTSVGDEQILDFDTAPFVFAFQTWDHIRVSSNGYLVAGDGTGTAADSNFMNQVLPDPVLPNNVLAPLWSDLDGTGAPGISTAALTDGTDSWLVVEWQLNAFGTLTQYNFQAWIGINGVEDISFVYGPVGGVPAPATVGAENVDGTVGDNYYANGVGTFPVEGTELRVTTTGTLDPPTGAVPLPAAIVIWSGIFGAAGIVRWIRRRSV